MAHEERQASGCGDTSARQKAPMYVELRVTSEQHDDITPVVADVKALVHDAGLVLVSAPKL